jgi:micrococcal nuclease
MKKIGIYVLFLIFCISSYADQMINVKCVKVSDGDTITVLQWNKEYKVRLYGIVFCENTSLNEELLKNGYAWHYKQYSKDSFYRDVFEGLEAEARRKKVGLWAGLNPQAPWEYRKDKRE